MKSREIKQRDLTALTESLAKSKSAMVVSFSKLSVTKDQEFRTSLREAGAEYQVVKNTLARIAVKGTPFEGASESFKGVTAIAWTENDPVILTKAISKFMKDNADTYTFKTGVLDGRLLDLSQVTAIASLPSKEELISKLLFVLNAQAQRIVTVINAVPRDLAIVIKQIGDAKPEGGAPAAEAKAEAPEAEAAPAVEAPRESDVQDSTAEAAPAADAGGEQEIPAVEASQESEVQDIAAEQKIPSAETAEDTEAEAEQNADAPDDAAKELIESSPSEGLSEAPEDKADQVVDDVAPKVEGDR